MVRQMQRSSDVSIRQLVATLLRQRISEYWDAVGRSERDSMKQGLLQMLLQETECVAIHICILNILFFYFVIFYLFS